jgi:hypothetical protein
MIARVKTYGGTRGTNSAAKPHKAKNSNLLAIDGVPVGVQELILGPFISSISFDAGPPRVTLHTQ